MMAVIRTSSGIAYNVLITAMFLYYIALITAMFLYTLALLFSKYINNGAIIQGNTVIIFVKIGIVLVPWKLGLF